jgi:hypothetical protein
MSGPNHQLPRNLASVPILGQPAPKPVNGSAPANGLPHRLNPGDVWVFTGYRGTEEDQHVLEDLVNQMPPACLVVALPAGLDIESLDAEHMAHYGWVRALPPLNPESVAKLWWEALVSTTDWSDLPPNEQERMTRAVTSVLRDIGHPIADEAPDPAAPNTPKGEEQ